MAGGPLVEIVDLTLSYGGVPALRSVSFDVGRGRVTGIVGESGSGKSTLGAAILRLLPPAARVSAGRILFEGRDLLLLSQKEMRALRGTRISFVSQDPLRALIPTLSIGRQMTEIQFRRAGGARRKRLRAAEMLDKIGVPDPEQRLRAYPHQLSGGQRQRVSIAMAMMMQPDLLIADEPTTALDATLEAQIIALLRELQDEVGCAMIFVTHDLGLLPELCDEVVVMESGEVREAGPVERVLTGPASDYTRMLVRCDPARVRHKTRRLPTRSGNRDAPDAPWLGPPDRIRHQDPPMLIVEGLDVTFRRASWLRGAFGTRRDFVVHAVKGASFSVAHGETVAIVGESGSGKTTIARSVLALQRPDRGSIGIDGMEVVGRSPRDLRPLRRKVAMMFQDPIGSLSPRFKVGSLVTEPMLIHGIPVPDRKREAIRLLDLVGLAPSFTERYPHELSGGEARRVGVARALSSSPELVVADEPTAGLDLSIQGDLFNLLAEIQERMGLAILIITHNLAVVRHISDRTIVMYQGEFLEQGSTEEIFRAPRHDYTRKLLAASRHLESAADASKAGDGEKQARGETGGERPLPGP